MAEAAVSFLHLGSYRCVSRPIFLGLSSSGLLLLLLRGTSYSNKIIFSYDSYCAMTPSALSLITQLVEFI